MESDPLVVFGDDTESDALSLTRVWSVSLGIADTSLRLLDRAAGHRRAGPPNGRTSL